MSLYCNPDTFAEIIRIRDFDIQYFKLNSNGTTIQTVQNKIVEWQIYTIGQG